MKRKTLIRTVIVLSVICATNLPRNLFRAVHRRWVHAANGTRLAVELVLLFVCLCYLVTSTYNPFLYFNF